MRIRVAGGLSVVAAAAIWFLWSGSGTPDVQPGGDSVAMPNNAQVPANADVGDEPSARSADPAEQPAQRSEVAVESPTGPKATVRGRCVDAAGAPLAGCEVTLRGRGATYERMEEWVRVHGEPQWRQPSPITTGEDGRFEFTFWPPPPFEFSLRIGVEQLVTMGVAWHKLDPGSTTDVGDVIMRAGVRVTGRVVDEDGAPLARQSVALDGRVPYEPGRVIGTSDTSAITRDDGTFASRSWLLPGTYQVRLRDLELLSATTVELVASRPSEQLTIVGRKPAGESIIAGRVIDETGAPASSVTIEDRPELTSLRTTSAKDGTFQLVQTMGERHAKARLRVYSELHETDDEAGHEVRWGARDVVLEVRRAGSLTLRVTGAEQAPIESYSVRMVIRNTGRSSSRDGRVLATGPHSDGTVTIPGLGRGDWLLIVEFPPESGLSTIVEPFRHEGGSRRMDVSTASTTTRMLRVVDGAGAPVAGTLVELCELFGQPCYDGRPVMKQSHWAMNHHDRIAMILFAGTTDADGQIELRGPAGRELGVRALGPGHIPGAMESVYLNVGGEAQLRVRRGARLVGRITPPDAMAALRRLRGGAPANGHERPKLKLIAGRNLFPRENLERMYLPADGAFDVEGLPPGTWNLVLECSITTGTGGSRQELAAGEISLADGQTLERDIDLTMYMPGRLEGTVLLNGEPATNAAVTLNCNQRWAYFSTDAEGRFACEQLPGDYTVCLNLEVPGQDVVVLKSATRATVQSGTATQYTIGFATGRCAITLFDAAGNPARNVRVNSFAPGAPERTVTTDASGRYEGTFDVGDWTLRVLPKTLADPRVLHKLILDAHVRGEQDPLGKHWIVLTTATIAPGQTTPVEVTLPASAGY